MIKIFLKTIIDLLKTTYDLINLAIHIVVKIIKIVFKLLCWMIKKLAQTIKQNREERAIIKYFSYNEYNGEKIPYLKGQNAKKEDKLEQK